MTFNNINEGCKCECLSGAVNISEDFVFLRKLNKTMLMEKDFKSHWDREIKRDSIDCEEICDLKGISIDKTESNIEELILERYRTTFNFNPQKGAYCLKFRLNINAGLIKFAPIPEINAFTHYNFYKDDNFTLELINNQEIIKFA
jgi:hypothetical protein